MVSPRKTVREVVPKVVLMLGFLTVFVANATEADDGPDWHEETFTGDWGGKRTALYKRGVNLGFTHKSDVFANVNGGLKRGAAWMGHSDASAEIDLDTLLGWQNTTALVHYHSQLGGKFNEKYAGGFSGVDNIEVGTNTAQFYQAWVQHNWLDDRMSVLAGLYAVDSEFDVTDSSGIFIQPPLGIAAEIAQSGVNGPPVFPLGTLGVRVKYISPNAQFYVQSALTDGVPGNPNHTHGTHIKLGNGDGTNSMLEFGYTPAYEGEIQVDDKGEESHTPANYMNKTAIGFWHFTHPLDDLVNVDGSGNPVTHHAQGIYFLTERTLFLEKEDLSQGLTGFFRWGFANEDVHQTDWTSNFGLHYIGLIDGRNDDIAGIAITVNHASKKYRSLNDASHQEINIEMTYKAQIKPWLFVQPDLQYIANPGMDKKLGNTTILGLRTEINF